MNYTARNLTVRPLSNDQQGAINQLNLMLPYEGTNISAGMAIGWQVVSPNLPFEANPHGDANKTVILLTDGNQTVPSFGPGQSYNDNEGEKNLEQMCIAMKAQGIRLITVAYSSSVGQSTRNRMQNCASEGSFYYEPENAEELAETFRDMAETIGNTARLVE